jgi:hypothetical protein
MLESGCVAFLGRKAGSESAAPSDTEELGSANPSALLRHEQRIRSIGVLIPQSSPERRVFIQRRLAFVPIDRLGGVERALHPANRMTASLHIQVPWLQMVNLRGPQPVAVRDELLTTIWGLRSSQPRLFRQRFAFGRVVI